ncbi:MAG: methyltransferase domain-containing protein, partial [Acidimicrobiales bacterium]
MTAPDLSFIAPPLEVSDWRMVLLVSAATDAGLLQSLPGRADDLAGRLGLHEHAVTVVLEALARYGVVEVDGDGTYRSGPTAPGADSAATLHHHARALRQWALTLDGRLRGDPVSADGAQHDPERWIDSLAVNARRIAPTSIDACLNRLPASKTVLDLGGGHGVYAAEFARRGLAATMQDRPVMVEIARRRGELEPAGVELFAGDFFDELAPGPFDLVFCSGVTNTFDGESNLRLYERIRSCLASDGWLVIQTSMRDRQPVAALFGVQMLVVGHGGDAHPEGLYRRWLAVSGYGPAEVIDVDDGRRSLLFAPVA